MMITKNKSNHVIAQLDELDLMLAKELELDARQTNRILAKKLATSESTVGRRLQRLKDEGVIDIVVRTSPPSMGLNTSVVMGLNVSRGKIDEVIEHLQPYKMIARIIRTLGRYEIVISAYFHSKRELNIFIREDLTRFPYIAGADLIIVLDSLKVSWKYFNKDTVPYHEPEPHDLDELDLKLIKELVLCPRESIVKLAKKLGSNRILLGKRLRSLMDDEIVRVISIAKPELFGLNLPAFIFVRVQPNKIVTTANAIVSERRVRHIAIATGSFNLFLNAVFKDMEEMSHFITNRLINLPGVICYETLIQVAFAKRSYSLLNSAEPPA